MAEPRSDPQTSGEQPVASERRAITLPKRIPELLYGAVVTGSVLAVSSLHGSSTEHVALATGVVAVIYWLAHVYVDAVGGRFHDLEHSTLERLGEALRTNTEVLVGSLPPIAVFLAARLLGADVELGAEIALWFTVGMLTCVGATAAYLAGVRGWRLVAETAIAGCFGLIVIGLKYLLH